MCEQLVLPQIIYGIPEWEQKVSNFQKLKSSLLAESKKIGKIIAIRDITQYPQPELLAEDILGTLEDDEKAITIYLDKISTEKNDPLFKFVLSHEFIHFQMDQEGYPITKNTKEFEKDTSTVHLGTLIQDSVLHYEVYRRQKDYDINTENLSKPVDNLLNLLKTKFIGFDSSTEKKIRSILSINGPLSKESSFKIMTEIITELKLTNRLYVDSV